MKNHFSTLLFLLATFMYGQTQINKTLLFSSDKSSLTTEHITTLDQLLMNLDSTKNYSIEVSGHSDSRGETEHNSELSERRTNAVVNYLVQNNIPENKISKSFFGESKPIVSNDTENGRKKNRRVEIIIRYTGEVISQNNSEDDSSTIWQLYDKMQTGRQEFCIDNSRDTVLYGEQGSILYINANIFREKKSSGKDKCINIQLKEVLLKSDMILENLSTTSNGNILESQGMIYINAERDGETVSLIPGKDIVIMVPTDTNVQDAQIFDGHRDPHDSIMNWTVNNNSALNNFALADLNECAVGGGSSPCPFFFCKIKKFFRKIAGTDNQQTMMLRSEIGKCSIMAEILKEYGINDMRDIIDNVNHPLYQQFNVNNFADLQEALMEKKLNDIELAYKNKKVGFENFSYYVFNTSNLGWTNIDVFAKMDKNRLTTLKVNLKADENIDVRLVFKKRNIVMPPTSKGSSYIFRGIPKGEKVWIVALKHDDETPYLSMTEETITNGKFEVEFVELTITELKEKLKQID